MNEKEIKRTIFWNMNLSGLEKRILNKAGFDKPEQFLDIPVVQLTHLSGFGFPSLVHLLEAMCEYYDLPNGDFDDFLDCIFEKKFRDAAFFSDHEEPEEHRAATVSVDEILAELGITDDEKIVKLTMRELLSIPGVDGEEAAYIADSVLKTYYCLYRPPEKPFNSIRDFIIYGDEFYSVCR